MTVGELLRECLRAAGVERVFEHDDPAMAALLADADGRLGPSPGAALLTGEVPGARVLRVSSRPGGSDPSPVTVERVEDLPPAVGRAVRAAWADAPATAEVRLALDLDAPASGVPIVEAAAAGPGAPFEPDGAVLLAGPGVLRLPGALTRLRRLAGAAGVGVVNTWGAKGVFAWDDPLHLGTAGLQARDFELAGFGDRDVVAIGFDPDEAPGLVPTRAWGAGLRLSPAAQAGAPPPRPRLYTGLAEVIQPMYEQAGTPPHAVMQLARHLLPGGVVAAEPGTLAGFWVARAFPTREPGSVVVPATRCRGIAAATALVARLRGRPAVAVSDRPAPEVEAEARRRGVALDVRVWTDEEMAGPALRSVLEVSGPIVAWGGLAPGGSA